MVQKLFLAPANSGLNFFFVESAPSPRKFPQVQFFITVLLARAHFRAKLHTPVVPKFLGFALVPTHLELDAHFISKSQGKPAT